VTGPTEPRFEPRSEPCPEARPARTGAAHLGADLRLALAESRLVRAEAEGIIRNHVIAGSTLAMAPLPLLDGILLFNLQLNLMGRLADHYGVAFNRFYAGVAASMLSASLPVLATGACVSSLKLCPGFGSLGAGATLSSLAGVVSYATGKVLLEHFEAGGTLEDLSTRAFRARFRAALREGPAGVRELLTGQPS
jgi:uncharacterized protein (DUF697 family)